MLLDSISGVVKSIKASSAKQKLGKALIFFSAFSFPMVFCCFFGFLLDPLAFHLLFCFCFFFLIPSSLCLRVGKGLHDDREIKGGHDNVSTKEKEKRKK